MSNFEQLRLFEGGMNALEQMHRTAPTPLVSDAVHATIDDCVLGMANLPADVEWTAHYQKLQELRRLVGLPRLEPLQGVPEGSDVLTFDFSERNVLNSFGKVVKSFYQASKRPTIYGNRHDAMRETFNVAKAVSNATSWAYVTDLYEIIEKAPDRTQTFNNRFMIVRQMAGDRIMVTESTPRRVIAVHKFGVVALEGTD